MVTLPTVRPGIQGLAAHEMDLGWALVPSVQTLKRMHDLQMRNLCGPVNQRKSCLQVRHPFIFAGSLDDNAH